jgi:hypothetical protein
MDNPYKDAQLYIGVDPGPKVLGLVVYAVRPLALSSWQMATLTPSGRGRSSLPWLQTGPSWCSSTPTQGHPAGL